MISWIELSPDYRCNNRCLGCFSVGDGPSMTAREMAAELARGRAAGAHGLWLGGGEPTLRPDLFAVVAHARKLGYSRVKLQTNGMMLAYPGFVRRCVAAGVTEVNLCIKGHTAELHDRLAATPGCFDLVLRGIENSRAAGLALEGDLLVYRSNAAAIPDMVRFFTPRGVGRYNVWVFSTVDQGAADLTAEVPRLSDVAAHVAAAMDLGLSPRPDFISSLHTPPCTVPATHHACLFHAADLGLRIVNPGGRSFMLEESPIEGGTWLERCEGCRLRARCDGIRADYLRVHGDSEFRPLR